MSTVTEIKAAIGTLSFKERAELERWLRDSGPGADDEHIPHMPSDLNPEEDTPELEAELLKAVNGPFTPFKPEDLRTACEQIAREKRRQ